MFYLITQIVLCLLFTTMIGITVGWLLRGMGTARHTDQVEAKWRAQIARLKEQRDQPPSGVVSESNTVADDGEVVKLRRVLAAREQEIATMRAASAERPQAAVADASIQEKLRESQTLCQQLQVRLADFSSTNDQLEKQLAHTATERQTIVQRLRNTETEIGRLTKEREHAINTITGLQKEMRTLRGTLSRETASATATVQAATSATRLLPPAVSGGGPDRTAEPPAPDTQQQLPIDEPAASPPAAYEPAWRMAQPDGSPDNLQAIYGVGPKLQQRLNELGIFHFRQIATFEKRDILWVAEHLRSFPGRILRDRWVEQARTLEQRRRSDL